MNTLVHHPWPVWRWWSCLRPRMLVSVHLSILWTQRTRHSQSDPTAVVYASIRIAQSLLSFFSISSLWKVRHQNWPIDWLVLECEQTVYFNVACVYWKQAAFSFLLETSAALPRDYEEFLFREPVVKRANAQINITRLWSSWAPMEIILECFPMDKTNGTAEIMHYAVTLGS